jgi:hypothetical protein
VRRVLNSICVFSCAIILCKKAKCDEYSRALKHIQKAVLKTVPVKTGTKRLEKRLKNMVGNSNVVNTTTAICLGALAGKISTRKFKNLRFKGTNWKVRPDVEHNFRDSNTSGSLNLEWDF